MFSLKCLLNFVISTGTVYLGEFDANILLIKLKNNTPALGHKKTEKKPQSLPDRLDKYQAL